MGEPSQLAQLRARITDLGDLEAERGRDAEAAIDLSLEEAFRSQSRDDL